MCSVIKSWTLGLLIVMLSIDKSMPEDYSDTFQYTYDECRNHSSYCAGYIHGVSDGMSALFPYIFQLGEYQSKEFPLLGNTAPFRTFCIKDGTTYGAMTQAVINYGQQHPEIWSSDPWSGVFSALHETWPCK
jgi:Rap1a immunity proteins